ncbi:MAG: tetratricopeptide repeat protein [Bacteroidetes bacterium]|nr:tetratricopeptide repeat protein [Bacteroidota bacterium]
MMLKNCHYFLLIFAFVSSLNGRLQAQSTVYSFSPNVQQAYREVFKLKINAAKVLLAKEKSPNALAMYVDNYADMVTLLVSDNKSLFDQLAPHQDERLSWLDDQPSSPYQRFIQAEIRLHWAFIKLKFGKEMSASWDIIKAYRLLAENARLYPDFVPSFKSLGLLHVLIGSAPQSYQWVAKLLGLKGNIPQGLREVQRAIQEDKVFGLEAQLIQLLLHSYILTYGEKQNADLLQLVHRQPDNLLLHFFGATVSMKDGRGEQALNVLKQRPKGSAYFAFPFLEYLEGEILLQKGQHDEARKQFNAFLSQYKGQNFLKDTYLKLFLSHWLLNEDAQAKGYIEKVNKVGATYVESDKAALKFAENYTKGLINNQQKILMKARLAFDGGYLEEAAAALRNVNESSFENGRDRAEFRYRLGRIFQRQEHTEAAIPNYERAIVLSQAQSFYFGATSALQLGYIYQAKGQRVKAIQYFQQALNYPKHEYKNSVDNKARAALTLLGVE